MGAVRVAVSPTSRVCRRSYEPSTGPSCRRSPPGCLRGVFGPRSRGCSGRRPAAERPGDCTPPPGVGQAPKPQDVVVRWSFASQHVVVSRFVQASTGRPVRSTRGGPRVHAPTALVHGPAGACPRPGGRLPTERSFACGRDGRPCPVRPLRRAPGRPDAAARARPSSTHVVSRAGTSSPRGVMHAPGACDAACASGPTVRAPTWSVVAQVARRTPPRARTTRVLAQESDMPWGGSRSRSGTPTAPNPVEGRQAANRSRLASG
jgi:hypothetical protein